MTAKEKAKELVDKYIEYVEAYSSQGQIENAKQCAIVTVDEIILHCNQYEWEYWQDVKQEISKL